MSLVEIETFEPVEMDGAMVVIAFQGPGAAGPIAGSYLHQQLQLPLVGQVRIPDLGPIVHIAAGLATSPIRIYGGEVECHLDKSCPRLYIVMSELAIPQELAGPLAEAILTWATGSELLLCLDSVARDENDREPNVFAISDSQVTLDELKPAKVEPLGGGIVVGVTAAVLGSSSSGPPTGALIVEAIKDHPDGRAAAALVAALDPLIEEIEVDVKPLLKEAMEIEASVRAALATAEPTAVMRAPHTFI